MLPPSPLHCRLRSSSKPLFLTRSAAILPPSPLDAGCGRTPCSFSSRKRPRNVAGFRAGYCLVPCTCSWRKRPQYYTCRALPLAAAGFSPLLSATTVQRFPTPRVDEVLEKLGITRVVLLRTRLLIPPKSPPKTTPPPSRLLHSHM